jgi:ABC-type uncharacterized transport system substrate-binding protein
MKKKVNGLTVGALLIAFSFAVKAQEPKKLPRIGILLVSTSSATAHLIEAFRHGLHDLGYVEGRNITIEQRFGEGKVERLPGLAAELVGLNVGLIIAATPPAISAAKQAANHSYRDGRDRRSGGSWIRFQSSSAWRECYGIDHTLSRIERKAT